MIGDVALGFAAGVAVTYLVGVLRGAWRVRRDRNRRRAPIHVIDLTVERDRRRPRC